MDLSFIFYFVWALFCLLLGMAGVVTSWCLPADVPRYWSVSVKVLTIILLLNAGLFFILTVSK